MVSLSTLSTIALMIATGVISAPWNPTTRYHTHRPRGVGPTGVQLNSYHPPSVFEGYGVNGVDHPLVKRGVKRATSEEAAKSFLQEKLGVAPEELIRHSGYSFEDMSYEYFTRAFNGIPVANMVANVALKVDKIVSYGASFVQPKSIAPATPMLSDIQVIAKAEQALGGKYNQWPTTLNYFAKDDGDLVLVRAVQIQDVHSGDWKQAYVNTDTGELENVVDFVSDWSYRALPIEKQDPTEGFEDINDPQDFNASPKGWHESKGVKTHETSGNNVVTYKGIDQNLLPISIPILDRLFSFILKPSKPFLSPTSQETSHENKYNYTHDGSKEPALNPNVDAARVNAFYVVNRIHDLTYNYGFKEPAFNFQNDNFDKGGKGNDRVQVSIQDPSGVNNANFATPPDGQPGQMRMFVWTMTKPLRDGALENDIIVHEATHGISNRMTGGGTGTCLQTTEAGGMGEGWSDAMADITEAKTNPISDFTMGSYVMNNEAGIRSYPYSVNKTTNPLTYGSLKSKNEVHAVGEVWANTLHGILHQLVIKYGLCDQSRLKDPLSTCGQAVMLHLVLDGFALQPCNPTFVTARNAIIQADDNRYGGANKCLLWRAFAERGLGNGAEPGDYTDNTDVPEGC